MHTKETLFRQIEKMNFRSSDSIMVHSSMKAIGKVEGGTDTVLDAFIEFFSNGLLMFPTHTWKDWNNPNDIFDPQIEPSCVGILTECFRKRKGVYRSLHPTHSIAATGTQAREYVENEEKTQTPGPRNGCWGRLYDINAKILFLGASLKTNTYLHSVEEWCSVPNRLSQNPTPFKIKLANGKLLDCPQYRHGGPYGDVSQNYDKIQEKLFQKEIATRGAIGDASCICCDAKRMGDYVVKQLQHTPNLFDNDSPFLSEF